MENQVQTEELKPAKPSLWGIIFDPMKQFERIRENPRIGMPLFWILLAVTVLGAITGYFIGSDPSVVAQAQKTGVSETFSLIMMISVTAVGSLFFFAFIIAFGSLIYWLLSLLFQGEASFKQMFSLNTHLTMLGILSTTVQVGIMAMVGLDDPQNPVSPTSLAAFVKADGFLAGVLNCIEVFSIWSLILAAMGLSVVARISKGKAWSIALIVFFVTVLFSGAGALMK